MAMYPPFVLLELSLLLSNTALNLSWLSVRYDDIDSNQLNLQFINTSYIEIEIPSEFEAGTIGISISWNNKDYGPSYLFDVLPTPTITSIVPNYGIIGYEYNIMVIGSNFPYNRLDYGQSQCWFTNTGNNSEEYQVIMDDHAILNSTHLSVTVPPYNDTLYQEFQHGCFIQLC